LHANTKFSLNLATDRDIFQRAVFIVI